MARRYRLPSELALSPRERQVVGLIAEGYEDKEIAQVLGIGYHTVKYYGITIRNKLLATNRPHMVARAIIRGEIALESQNKALVLVGE